MNVENLKNNYSKLITYMEVVGYTETYIDSFRNEIQRILTKASSKDWSCYGDVYRDYVEKLLSPNSLRTKRTIIGTIEQFDIHGSYPDGKMRNGLVEKGSYPHLAPEFKSLVDYYSMAERERGKKESSIYTEFHNASTFLLYMQEVGISRLDEVTEDAVMSVFVSTDGKQLKSHSYGKSISAFLKACTPLNPDACRKVLSFIPATRQTRKNIQYLTPQETQKIRDALYDTSNMLTLRDRAIGKLVFYTGLRCGDIAAMEMASIDWECDMIRIKQQKTGVTLELPLTATVGNAIYDYLTAERPSAEASSLFLSRSKPYRSMSRSSMGHVAARIMEAAGVRQSKGDRKGLHIFRHHLATTLLSNGVSQAVISRTLGHSSPDSIDTYLSADFPHLKECALSIASFPVSGGVFGDE